jgi:uncharacterized protein (TIGR02453 family)
MFEGFSQRTIDFMWNIRLNNEKVWFEAHKDEYRSDFQLPMKELGTAVYERVASECGRRGLVLKFSRIYRDARRLHSGQGLYRDNLWFSLEKPSDEWTADPVFWFEIAPEGWSYGLGYYSAKPMTMAKLRARLDADPKKFERLVAFLSKQDEFVLDGPEYARKKEAPTAKTAAWYNKKSFSLVHSQPNGEELYSPALVGRIASGFKSLMPLYDYLITLDSDPMPVK